MFGSEVCRYSLTLTPPVFPISRPQSFASEVSGFTPIASIAISYGIFLPEFKIISSAPKAFTPSESIRFTPCFRISFWAKAAVSLSTGGKI